MARRPLAVLSVVLLALVCQGEIQPDAYRKITQCVLVRERRELAGAKVQLSGRFVAGSRFCYDIGKTGLNTRDYICFALGKPCMIRLYLKKDHPQAELVSALQEGDQVTAYGTFGFLGSDYNYMVLDAILAAGPGAPKKATPARR